MRIVAFVDGSLYAQSVIDHASWLATGSGAGLDLVQIVSPNELIAGRIAPLHPGGSALLDTDQSVEREVAQLKESAKAQLSEASARLAEQGLYDVRIYVLEGVVGQLMTEVAAGASLIVMGKRGEHADLAHLQLGSHLEAFVRSTDVPVLAVSRIYRSIDRAMIAFNLDPASTNTVVAIASGLFPSMSLKMLHVGDESDVLIEALGRAAAILCKAGYQVETEVIPGVPGVVVPARVVYDQVGLVAIGAFSGSRLKSLIFGSLTSELIRACQVPILLF